MRYEVKEVRAIKINCTENEVKLCSLLFNQMANAVLFT